MSWTMGACNSTNIANMMLMRDELSIKESPMAMLNGGRQQLTSFPFTGLDDGNASKITSKRPFWAYLDEGMEGEASTEKLAGMMMMNDNGCSMLGSPQLKKKRLTIEQVKSLEVSFDVDNKLEPERKQQLAEKLGLQPRQVAVWFQNRRARWKTKQLEQEFGILKSQYDCLLAETHKLKSEVSRLTAELEARRGGALTEGPSCELTMQATRREDNTFTEVALKVDNHEINGDDQAHKMKKGRLGINAKQDSVSPTCSDYSDIVDGGSPSFSQGEHDASLIECRIEHVDYSLHCKEETFLDGLVTSTNMLQSSHHILSDCSALSEDPLSNHIAFDWLWELTT